MGTIREALIVALGGVTKTESAREVTAATDKMQKHVDYANFEVKLLKERILAYKAQMQAAIGVCEQQHETIEQQSAVLREQDAALKRLLAKLNDEEIKEGESHATLH